MANYFEYKGYHTRIEFDYDDQVLFGKIEGIKDLVSFEADNATEIEKSFHEAVDDYLEFCTELGVEPNKEFKGCFNVRITPELHRKAANRAYEKEISLNQFIQDAIENELNGRNDNITYIMMPQAIYHLDSFNSSFGNSIFMQNYKVQYFEERDYAIKN